MLSIFASLILLGPVQDDVNKLVEQMGSEDYAEREEAERKIRELGAKARPALEAAKDHEDLEVRTRIRQLLSEAGFLPVEEAWRETVSKLDHESLSKLREGVEELLKGAREDALKTLKVCEEWGQARLKFRVKQLIDILTREAAPPLRYGILVAQPEFKADDKVAGLEFWINESQEPMKLKDLAGKPTLEELEPQAKGPGGGMVVRVVGGVGRERKNPPPFELTGGASRILERQDLTEDASSPYRITSSSGFGGRGVGAHALSREYKSDGAGADESQGKVWEGIRKSNRVEFKIR